MSLNIYIHAEKESKKKGVKKSHIEFSSWQTSTSESEKIVRSSNQMEAYKEWVKTRIPMLEESYISWETGKPNIVTENSAREHLRQLEEWLDYCWNNDYQVFVDLV